MTMLLPLLIASAPAPLATPVELPYRGLLPGQLSDYELLMAEGEWGREYLLHVKPLTADGWSYLCTSGRCAHPLKPLLAVRHRQTRAGLALALAYSGNWAAEVRQADPEQIEISLRCSPAGAPTFCQLGDDQALPVPGALVADFRGDWDDATLPIRRYFRAHLQRSLGSDWPPVQYNDWYFHSAEMSTESLLRCASAAAEVGCEQFTVDAGWYGTRPDWGYLGEWTVNAQRFPNGLGQVREGVRALGLKFGLWVEIECGHPEVPFINDHPDWVLPGTEHSSRLVLNLGVSAAREHVIATLDRLIDEYQLDYLKMDFNTDCPTGSEGLHGAADPLLGHLAGLYEVWRHLRSAHPRLIVENCSSGSLRYDLAGAALTDTHWVSDEIANGTNLTQNYGATLWFPPETCSHWTVYPEDPEPAGAYDLRARLRANFTGHFGLSGDIAGWQPATRQVIAEEISWYKRFRGHLSRSDVYHLSPPSDGNQPPITVALQYHDPRADRSILLAFRRTNPAPTTAIRLRALDPGARYRVSGDLAPREVPGAELLDAGLTVVWQSPGECQRVVLERIAER